MKRFIHYKWLCIQLAFWKLITPFVVILHLNVLTLFCIKKVMILSFQLMELCMKQQVYNKHHLSA